MRRSTRIRTTACILAAAWLLGCATERTVYRKVPRYWEHGGNTAGEYIDEDGTRVVITYQGPAGASAGSTSDAPADTLRQTREDGGVRLVSILPEHVLHHLLQCLVAEDYELLWNELLAKRTRDEYAAAGQGFKEFEAFFREYRNEIYGMTNRMAATLRNPEIEIITVPGAMRIRFHPSVGSPFDFSTIDMVNEGYSLKLMMIH